MKWPEIARKNTSNSQIFNLQLTKTKENISSSVKYHYKVQRSYALNWKVRVKTVINAFYNRSNWRPLFATQDPAQYLGSKHKSLHFRCNFNNICCSEKQSKRVTMCLYAIQNVKAFWKLKRRYHQGKWYGLTWSIYSQSILFHPTKIYIAENTA